MERVNDLATRVLTAKDEYYCTVGKPLVLRVSPKTMLEIKRILCVMAKQEYPLEKITVHSMFGLYIIEDESVDDFIVDGEPHDASAI